MIKTYGPYQKKKMGIEKEVEEGDEHALAFLIIIFISQLTLTPIPPYTHITV